MKFLNESDKQLFLIEIGRADLIESTDSKFVPTDEMVQSLLKGRESLTRGLKDHRKGQDTKQQWRKNRTKMMKGIKAYHKSTEGKRFHRNLGNFLATRIVTRESKSNSAEIYETLKALTSAKTHMYIELEYFHQVFEQHELDSLTDDYALPMLSIIEDKVRKNEDLSDDELCFLIDITEATALIKSLSDKSGTTEKEVEAAWDSIKSNLLDSGHKETDDSFYAMLVGALKKSLHLT